MKSRIPSVLIGSSLQAAVVLYPTPAEHEAEVILSAPSRFLPLAESSQGDFGPLQAPSADIEASPATLVIPVVKEWDGIASRRFRELAEKEAFETAGEEELRELGELTRRRRHERAPRRGDEVMREYEQGQLVRDLLRSLQRYVDFENRKLNHGGTGKTRGRASAKA
jgi:hypothetical protein